MPLKKTNLTPIHIFMKRIHSTKRSANSKWCGRKWFVFDDQPDHDPYMSVASTDSHDKEDSGHALTEDDLAGIIHSDMTAEQ